MGRLESYANLRARGVTPLSEVLPLDTPLSLMIDPSNVCNFKCVFCPTGDQEMLESVERPIGLMSIDLFRKIIDDLTAFPSAVQVIHLYKDGEPLANKELPAMIAHAKRSGRVSRIETTTNGSLLTEDRAARLIEAGLDGIRISVYALDDQGYRDVARTKTKFETIRLNVERFFALKTAAEAKLHVHVKIVDAGLSHEAKAFFIETFTPISDSLHIDSIMGWSTTPGRDLTLGLNPETGMSGQLLDRNRRACSEPFMKLAINFNGEVSVCCVDWAHETMVGHVQRQSLQEIWNGSQLRELRLKHLTGRRHELRACRSCQYLLGLPEHTNLDHAAERLIRAYSDPELSGVDSRGFSADPSHDLRVQPKAPNRFKR